MALTRWPQVDISIGEADHEDVAKGEVDRMIQAALNQAQEWRVDDDLGTWG